MSDLNVLKILATNIGISGVDTLAMGLGSAIKTLLQRFKITRSKQVMRSIIYK